MDQKDIDRTRYFELKKQLEEASRLYYKEGVSPMSDQDFDFGLKEMEALEEKYPELRGKDSLTQRVGSDLTNDFAKVTHAVPMLSIANVYSAEEMAEFVKAAEDGIAGLDERENSKGSDLIPHTWICERKIDGVSLSIVYENGRLKQAATRGDGAQGDDVTLNALTIADIPEYFDAKKLKIDPSEIPQGTFEVRGEVYMEREAFERLNEQFILEGKKIFQNPRNTVRVRSSSRASPNARHARCDSSHTTFQTATTRRTKRTCCSSRNSGSTRTTTGRPTLSMKS